MQVVAYGMGMSAVASLNPVRSNLFSKFLTVASDRWTEKSFIIVMIWSTLCIVWVATEK